MSHSVNARAEGGGLLTFAAVLFLVGAAFNTVYGIAALSNDDYFAADELLFGDLSMWGALYLAVAAGQLGAGLLILSRRPFGAFLGVALAVIHGTIAMLSIAAYPVWTVIVLVVDGMIIYGLTVYGFEE
jgi:hypothetical protein